MRHFIEYQALGNRYLVATNPVTTHIPNLLPEEVREVCANGGGRDGVLEHAAISAAETTTVRAWIWNADGTLAENSGNGTRILAKYLITNSIQGRTVGIDTGHTIVTCEVPAGDQEVIAKLGRVNVKGVATLDLPGLPRFEVHTASVGNPHCVCFVQKPDAQLAQEWGPCIERHPRFPDRTNVQFVAILDRRRIQMEIWERGSGYTLSSGSSASAAVGVARHLGMVDEQVLVQMPGGELIVTLDHDHIATIRGPVEEVGTLKVGK